MKRVYTLKEKKREKVKDHYFTLGLVLLALSMGIFIIWTQNQFAAGSVPITGRVFSDSFDLDYNVEEMVIKDITNLKYDLSGEKILINGERGFEFYFFAEQEIYNSKKPVKRKNLVTGKQIFDSKENVKDVIIEQEIIFSNNRPVKFNHYLTNTKDHDLENLTYYYVFDIFQGDEILINGSECDYLGKCEYIGKEEKNRVNFNREYNFRFDDLINMGFNLTEVRFEDNKLWLGFANNEILRAGEEIELDPTFSTEEVHNLCATPLARDMFVLSWIVQDDSVKYAVYYTNGTRFGSDRTISRGIRMSYSHSKGVSSSAFNSTHFVTSWYNHRLSGYLFNVSDIHGNFGASGSFELGGNWDETGATAVCTLNETHFVGAWLHEDHWDVEAQVYNVQGNTIGSLIEPDTDMEGYSATISLSCLNSTRFVVAWYDNATWTRRYKYAVYDTDGTEVLGDTEIYYTFWGGYGRTVQVQHFNETHFAFSTMVTARPGTKVMDIEANILADHVDLVGHSTGTSRFTDVATLNRTHYVVAFRQNWAPYSANSFAVYDLWGNEFVEPTNFSTDANNDLAVASENRNRGIEICNDNFIAAWANTTSLAEWRGYFPNGTIWRGHCIDDGLKINLILFPSNNTIRPGIYPLNISVTSDNSTVSGCSYSFNNGISNTSMTQTGEYWSASKSVSGGFNTITFFCQDSNGMNARTQRSFTVGLIPVDVENPKWDFAGADIGVLSQDMFVLVYSGNPPIGRNAAYKYAAYYKIYYTNGTQFGKKRSLIGWFSLPRIRVEAFNSTHFAVFHGASNVDGNYISGNLLFSIYDIYQNVIVNWSNITTVSSWTWSDVAPLNETHVVFPHSRYSYGGRVYYSIYDAEGNIIVEDREIENSVGTSSSYQKVSASAFNDTHFVVCYHDNFRPCVDNCLKCEVWSVRGQTIGANVTLSTNIHNYSRSLDVTAFNDSHYVVSVFDSADNANVFWVYDALGNQVVGRTETIDTGTYDPWDKMSQVASFNETAFVSTWAVINASFRPYSSKGVPYLSSFQNASIELLVDGNNGTRISPVGARVYSTDISLCENTFVTAWNETHYKNPLGLAWQSYYANGSKWNGICQGPCEYYGGGDWIIECDANCTIPTNFDGDGSDIYIIGDGHTTITGNITGFSDIHINGQGGHCRVTIMDGGSIDIT